MQCSGQEVWGVDQATRDERGGSGSFLMFRTSPTRCHGVYLAAGLTERVRTLNLGFAGAPMMWPGADFGVEDWLRNELRNARSRISRSNRPVDVYSRLIDVMKTGEGSAGL